MSDHEKTAAAQDSLRIHKSNLKCHIIQILNNNNNKNDKYNNMIITDSFPAIEG